MAPGAGSGSSPIPVNFSQDKVERREKRQTSMFLRSVIQPTDSTWTGCNANSAAANQEPGTRKRLNSLQTSKALAAWRRMLIIWYGAGLSPQNARSKRNVV